MNYYPEVVVLDEKVYVRAGVSNYGINAVVMVYNRWWLEFAPCIYLLLVWNDFGGQQTLTAYWHRASLIPAHQYKMSLTTIGNMTLWYLLGGYTSQSVVCTCVCIDDLIYYIQHSHSNIFQIAISNPAWNSSSKCIALNLNGAFLYLAIGGKYCSAYFNYLYQPIAIWALFIVSQNVKIRWHDTVIHVITSNYWVVLTKHIIMQRKKT